MIEYFFPSRNQRGKVISSPKEKTVSQIDNQ